MEKVKTIVISLIAVLPAVSCGRPGTSGIDALPFVRQTIADTASVEHSTIAGYDDADRFGTIAVIGPMDEASLLTGYLMECDLFDNVDARAVPDGLADFAGETFAPLYDMSAPQYYNYFRDGKEEDFREMTVRHTVAAVSGMCSQNAYSRDATVEKVPSKMVVLSSSLASVALPDIDMLFSAMGKSLPVISPVNSLVRQAVSRYREGTRVGIWASNDVLASGVYATAFHEVALANGIAAIDYVGFTPSDSLSVTERFFGYLDMYMASGDDKPLSVILLDDYSISGHSDELNGLVFYIRTSEDEIASRYRPMLSDDCTVLAATEAVAAVCYGMLRNSNGFTHRIAYPRKTEYMIIPSQEHAGEVKYIEMSNIYVQ